MFVSSPIREGYTISERRPILIFSENYGLESGSIVRQIIGVHTYLDIYLYVLLDLLIEL